MVELFAARTFVLVKLAAETTAARSTRVAESSNARNHGSSTDICKLVHKVHWGRTALRRALV